MSQLCRFPSDLILPNTSTVSNSVYKLTANSSDFRIILFLSCFCTRMKIFAKMLQQSSYHNVVNFIALGNVLITSRLYLKPADKVVYKNLE